MPPPAYRLSSNHARGPGLDGRRLCAEHIVAFHIPHDIYSVPLEVECVYDLDSLFKLLTGRHMDEFTVPCSFEYSIHGNTSRRVHLGRGLQDYFGTPQVTVTEVTVPGDRAHIQSLTKGIYRSRLEAEDHGGSEREDGVLIYSRWNRLVHGLASVRS